MYLPAHTNGDRNHKDRQDGVVSSVGEVNVFVKYDNAMGVMMTGDERYTAQATDPRDLYVI